MIIPTFIYIFKKEKIKSVQKVFKKYLQSVQKVLKYSYKMSGEKKNTKNRWGGLEKMYQFNKDLIHISVDSGKGGSKYAFLNQNSEISTDVIVTNVKEIPVDDEFQGSADKVIFHYEDGDKAFAVGSDEDDLFSDNENTKLLEKHEVCIYTCIAKVLTQHLSLNLDNEINVSLTVNVPLAEFKLPQVKQQYLDTYRNKTISLTINNRKVTFKIAKISVFYESQGAIIRNSQLINKEDELSYILVVDCGSRNDTHVLFNNKIAPVKGKNAMGRSGINNALRRLVEDLETEFEDDFTIPQVESALLGKSRFKCITREELLKKFEPHAVKLAEKIRAKSNACEVNKNITDVVFTGGASMVLRNQLEKAYQADGYTVYFSADARFDNARGALIKELSKLA